MNEQIKQFADHAKAYANQCTKDLDGDISWHWMDYYTEKFAELIVKECMSLVSEPGPDMNDTERGILAQIKQHFGAEL